jgi:hypothetical protein
MLTQRDDIEIETIQLDINSSILSSDEKDEQKGKFGFNEVCI